MKLRNLIEATTLTFLDKQGRRNSRLDSHAWGGTDTTYAEFSKRANLRKVAQKHLVVSITSNDKYVITDIPRLTEEQFEKLKSISFNPTITHNGRPQSSYINMFPPYTWDNKKWDDWEEQHTGPLNVHKLKWKELVAKVEEKYPDNIYKHDDFSE